MVNQGAITECLSMAPHQSVTQDGTLDSWCQIPDCGNGERPPCCPFISPPQGVLLRWGCKGCTKQELARGSQHCKKVGNPSPQHPFLILPHPEPASS